MSKFSLAAAMLLAGTAACHAQSQIEWKQVIDTPKGISIPRDRADILGIELGDTIETVKAKMAVLLKEGRPKDSHIEEMDRTFQMRVTNSSSIVTASYVSSIVMVREMPGKRSITDKVAVFLSAPSSGQQVLGIDRMLSYNSQEDQPRISEVVGQVRTKMKFEPQFNGLNETADYVWQFDNGQPLPRGPGLNRCNVSHGIEEERSLAQVNESGDCDGLLRVEVNYGFSRDHAKYLTFRLTDNDRTKANLTADFAYVRMYIRDQQNRSRGVAPKL